MRRVCKGVTSAQFETLRESYEPSLMRYCRTVAQTNQDAEDVLQELWVRAWVHRQSLGQAREPYAWLMRCMKRLLIDEMRKRKRRQRYVAPDGAIKHASTPAPSPMATALARLHRRHRVALELMEVQRLHPADAGCLMGCSQRVVGIQWVGARKALERELSSP